jgi:N-acetylglucosamine-6-phosphate deacetylase
MAMPSASFRGRHYRTGQAVEVVVESGRIAAVEAVPVAEGDYDLWLAPGLVDVQVNGFAGFDLNAENVTADDVSAMIRAQWSAGVTLCCPTITTGSAARMLRSLRAVAAAIETDAIARHAIAGVHVEGPYISLEDGPRGAHPVEHVRLPNLDEYRRFAEASGGRIRVFSLAPELPGGTALIERLAADGVVPALAHHAAPAEAIRAAVAAGARLSTHLGNGSHALLPRHPNYLWDQLAEDGLWASLILDGHHLPPAVVKTFLRAKGLARTILVSDAVHVAGLAPGHYGFMGKAVEVSASGRVSLAGTPYLAGSALRLCQALPNAMAFAGISLAEAVDLATDNPARLLGIAGERGRLNVGQPADLILFRLDAPTRRIDLEVTVAAGEVVYRGEGTIAAGLA